MRTTVRDPRILEASVSELEISLLFLQWEEDRWFDRWDNIFGTTWTPEDIQALAEHAKAAEEGDKPLDQLEKDKERDIEDANKPLRYPLSLLIRPELLQTLRERAIPALRGSKNGMPHVPSDAISLSDTSKNEFLRKLGALPVSSDDPRLRGGVDPYSTSQRPQEGFSEGTRRRIGGR